ncbi:MAG: hypothetical protein ACI9KE_005836 [Polyangiales bacterium]|jgi:hypothetical protein
MNIDALIKALESIGGPVCLAASQRLGAGAHDAPFDLHLRDAELDAVDARALADGMQTLARPGTALPGTALPVTGGLRSFSASYNSDLKDAGAIALAGAFPTTMTELGLVGCSIGDAGGRALLEWAERASHLRMMCVEGNGFSSGVRSNFARLGRRRTSLIVVV